jgi:hypothetical protein
MASVQAVRHSPSLPSAPTSNVTMPSQDLACTHQRQNGQYIQSEREPFSLELLADRVFENDLLILWRDESCERDK